MASKTSVLFEHTQRYIREVMADLLRAEGFVSRKGEDINWYRVVNNEVIQSVYFTTRHTALPAFLDIGYGSHPFFIPPVFSKGPYLYAEPGYEQICDIIPELIPDSTPYGYRRSQILKTSNAAYRIPDALIMCPADDRKGSDILEQVLLMLERMQTPLDCYYIHKAMRQKQIDNRRWLTMSPYFVDEVVYWDDEPLYSYCREYILGMIDVLERAEQTGRFFRKADKERLEELKILRELIFEGNRDSYLLRLKEREVQIRRLLERNTGIHLL